jgi:hypothetical protein
VPAHTSHGREWLREGVQERTSRGYIAHHRPPERRRERHGGERGRRGTRRDAGEAALEPEMPLSLNFHCKTLLHILAG